MIALASRRAELSRARSRRDADALAGFRARLAEVARSPREHARAAVRVAEHSPVTRDARACGTIGRLAMSLIRATPLARPGRITPLAPFPAAAGLFACSRAAGEPVAATRGPAPLVVAGMTGSEVHVPDDMSPKPPTSIVAGPLDPARRAAFLAPRADEPAAELGGVTEARKGQHYVTGNERALEAFYPRIRELGGAYVGVGSDQAYLLLGWARAELAWLIDYDPVVVDLHAVYHAFFAAAATPELFVALWQQDSKARAIAVLHAAYPGDAGRRHELLYRLYRYRVARRLGQLQLTMSAAAVPTFLTDPDQYTHVRDLVQAGRVGALLADLSREGAVQQIGAAARSLGTPVRARLPVQRRGVLGDPAPGLPRQPRGAARRRPLGGAAHAG